MKKLMTGVIVAIVLLSSCSSIPTKDIKFDTEADPKVNFAGYETYAWLGAAAILNDPYGQWEPPTFDADAEIKFLIDRELRKRGMSENSADPDMFVVFAAGIDMETLELKADPQTKMEKWSNVPQGALLIAMVDGESTFVIWAGVATAEIQQSPDTQTVKARLDYAVTGLLKELPRD